MLEKIADAEAEAEAARNKTNRHVAKKFKKQGHAA
jgi:hypothetical protein